MLLIPLFIAGCGSGEETQAPPPPNVSALQVKAEDTPIIEEFVGKTASSRRVEIRSRVEGFLEEISYREGSLVEEGQVLFRMDRKPFEARLNAAKASLSQQQARLANAKANLDRVKPLAEKRAVSQKDLDDAIGTYLTASAAVEGAKADLIQAELNLGYTIIYSPVTGLSSFAVKREGTYMGLGNDSLLTYVARLDPMWVEFSVSENQILRSRQQEEKGLLKGPEKGELEVEIMLADGSIYQHTGQITFADASLSEETGTFLIRAEVANPEQILRPGQFVRARLKGIIRPNAIKVPRKAVQQGAQGSFVWIVNAEDKAEFRPVVTGPWHEDDWLIDSGLRDGETVVVDGALKLRAGVPVTISTPQDPKEQTPQKEEDQAPKS
jgi:membrane fusion protein (multidrug efflux system)